MILLGKRSTQSQQRLLNCFKMQANVARYRSNSIVYRTHDEQSFLTGYHGLKVYAVDVAESGEF